MNRFLLSTLCLSGLLSCGEKQSEIKSKTPNILLIYVDDLGYGDIGINGARGVETPNIDSLAVHGINFTDMHCSAATCTPSRYSLLTGSYAFRANAAVLPGDAPLLIDPEQKTLPDIMRDAGYHTGVVGKWHLGLGRGEVNWNHEIKPGPAEIGFDYSFLLPATGDRVPCVFVENQKVVNLDPNDPIKVSYDQPLEGYPTGIENPEILKQKADLQHSQTVINGISRIGFMSGGSSALWKDEEFPFVFVEKAKQFIDSSVDKPFFLYFATHDIHVPRIIHPDFVGKSSMGPRGDAIWQVDWCVGELVDYLEQNGMRNNTMIIFTSDNGPVLDDGYEDMSEELVGNHNPSGPYRGGKYSAYEAGTRVPTIVNWPGTVMPGINDELLSQIDLFASLASLTGQELSGSDAPDSYDFMDSFIGKSKTGREILLLESFTMALRKNNWKYIHPQEKETPSWLNNKKIENGLSDEPQLYELSSDPGETNNLAGMYPDLVNEFSTILDSLRIISKTRTSYLESK